MGRKQVQLSLGGGNTEWILAEGQGHSESNDGYELGGGEKPGELASESHLRTNLREFMQREAREKLRLKPASPQAG